MAKWISIAPENSKDKDYGCYAEVLGVIIEIYRTDKKGVKPIYEWHLSGVGAKEVGRGKAKSMDLAKNASLNKLQGLVNRATQDIEKLWIHF
jgi:hypothetical protein